MANTSGRSGYYANHGREGAEGHTRWSLIWRFIENTAKVFTLVAVGIVLAALADRAPPFKVIEAMAPAGVPGSKITMEARVWRDAGRRCSATMYRSIFHSGGKRVDLEPQFFGPEDIETMERKNPGMMRPEIDIPKNAAPGMDSYMSTRLRYVCNRYQVILPIDVHVVQPFSVISP